MQIFDFLLSRGADPSLLTYKGWDNIAHGTVGLPQSIYDICVDKGRGWHEGRVRNFLRVRKESHATALYVCFFARPTVR